MNSTKLKHIVIGGVVMTDYCIEYVNSQVRIWSKKHGKLKALSIPKNGKSKYPKVTFRHEGDDIKVDIHRVVAENLIPFPKPEGITHKDWRDTPESIKSIMKSVFFVNHIDHDKYNCNPTNLEWVTPKGNCRAYHAFTKGI